MLPKPARQGLDFAGEKLGQGFKALTDFIGSNPKLQEWATKNPDAVNSLNEVLGTTAAAGTIAGEISGAKLGGNAVSSATRATTNVAKNTAKATVETTKKAVKAGRDTVSDVLTHIDKPTESVLNPNRLIPEQNLSNIPEEVIKRSAEAKMAKLEEYVNVSRKAAVDYSKPTALVKAGEKGGEALSILREKMSRQSALKKKALGNVGTRTVNNVGAIRANLRDLIRERVGVNFISKDGKVVIEDALGRRSKVGFDPADNRLMTDAYNALRSLGSAPTVREIDDIVDSLQDLLYKRKTLTAVPVNGQVEGVLKEITGRLNNAVKKVAGEQYTKANAKLSSFIDTFEQLNKALGDEGVRGATLMKSLFSPSGEAPRRLFNDIKELTGIDLVEEATLAKFAMESVGDARQASLLEEVIRGGSINPTDFIGKAVQRMIGSAQDPLGKARKIITEDVKP